jgi:hypothetical protein
LVPDSHGDGLAVVKDPGVSHDTWGQCYKLFHRFLSILGEKMAFF